MPRRLAQAIWLVSLLVAATGVTLTVAAGSARLDDAVVLLFLAMGTLGLVITRPLPANPVGWLLLATGFLAALQTLAIGLADPLAGTGAKWHQAPVAAALTSHAMWAPTTFVPLVLVPLLFPHGNLPSRRWRIVVAVAVVGIAGTAIGVTLHEAVAGTEPRWEFVNPLARDYAGTVLACSWALVVISLLGAGSSLLVRFRRAGAGERQQLKWVVYGGVVAVTLWMVGGQFLDETLVGGLLTATAITLIPVCIAAAILRYRLYDIDRLISRTVTYALVAGALALVFAAIAIGLPQLLRVPGESPFLVAAATLAGAALFNPLRRRVHAGVIAASTGPATTLNRRSITSPVGFAANSSWVTSPGRC